MPITLFGTAKSHTDGASVYTDGASGLVTASITPPSNMVAGHLVILDVAQRATTCQSGTFDIVNTGGQTWTSNAIQTLDTTPVLSIRRHWCRFNGTWSADPSVYIDGDKGPTTPYTVLMTVFAPSVAGSTWAADTSEVKGEITVSATTLTVPAVTTSTNGAVAVSYVTTPDNNDCSLTTAGNWTSAIVGWDNLAGTGLTSNVHYCVQTTAGSTGTYVLTENTGSQDDNARYLHQAYIDTPSTTKKLKLLAHSSAAGATSVSGVVWASSAGLAGTEYGEFTGKSFEATLESGKAVLKVPVADFGGTSLTTSDTPVALAKTSTKTTGLVTCTVIEE